MVVAQQSGAQRHALDRAGDAANPHRVADLVLVLHEDEEAVDDVVDQGLRAEADGEPGDAGAGQQRRHVDAQHGQDLQQREKYRHEDARAVDDAAEGPQLLRAQTAQPILAFRK